MDGFAILIVAVTFVLAIVALNKIAKLETRLAQLKLEMAKLATAAPAIAVQVPATEAVPETPPEELVTVVEAPSSANWQTQSAELPPAGPPRDMEQALASRWFVWIGGVAIAIGGLLFVKYAYDNGLISPALQVLLGLAAGLALTGAGEWVRRKATTSAEQQTSYVPAALSAAGLATLFAAIYAAYALYGLIDPWTAFAGLALVGLGALGLSRWQGPLIAALGLIGSYATPTLIPSENPSAWSFFPYLLVILAASFATLRGKTWWWLGYAAVAGSFLWSLLWLETGPFELADLWPVGLFANLLWLIAVFGNKGTAILGEDSGDLRHPRTITPPLGIGLAGLAAAAVVLGLLVHQTSHATAALMLFAAAMAAIIALAWAKPGISALAPLAGFLMFFCLMGWREAAFHAWAVDELGVWSWSNSFGTETSRFLRWMLLSAAGFALAGSAGVLLRARARNWGLLGGGAAFLFIWGAWARADFLLGNASWAIIAAGFALLLLAGVYAANRRAEDASANLGAGLLAAGAAALLVLALDRLYDRVWLTIALAVLALAFALASHVLKPKLMGAITAALATLATLRLFLSRELWTDNRDLPWGQHWVL